MAQPTSPFNRAPLGNEPRFVSGSTGASLGTLSQRKEQANMARLEGTGKDPLGRYGKGEIFDVPQYTPSVASSDADRVVNPVYQELLDKGYAKEVKPEDDPGRTRSQIAAAVAGTSGAAVLSDPVDAALAAKIDENDARAIVHTGDPKATAADIGGGDLKPDNIKDTQQDAKGQAQPSPRFLGDDNPRPGSEAAEAESADTGKASGSGSTGGTSRSGSGS